LLPTEQKTHRLSITDISLQSEIIAVKDKNAQTQPDKLRLMSPAERVYLPSEDIIRIILSFVFSTETREDHISPTEKHKQFPRRCVSATVNSSRRCPAFSIVGEPGNTSLYKNLRRGNSRKY
jgi:hypothetical protein